MDKKQLEVINSNPNIIVSGGPGTGKTLLSIHIANLHASNAKKVALVVFTKALRTFIEQNLSKANTNTKVYYEREWDRDPERYYDIIIVDEFQDFSLTDMKKLIDRSNIGVYLFGDTEQKLYKKNLSGEETLNLESLKNLTNFKIVNLTENFRVPIPIFNLIKDIYKHNLYPPKEKGTFYPSQKKYQPKKISRPNKNSELPLIIKLENSIAQMDWIVNFLGSKHNFKNIGILFKQNKTFKERYPIDKSFFEDEYSGVYETCRYLRNKEIDCGYKLESSDNLKFMQNPSINLLTIHSAKGLEFDCVILPFYGFRNSNVNGNLPYIAFSRCSSKLIILYSGIVSDELHLTNAALLEGEIRKKRIWI
ncbi:MAG: 3'-5' exonuclease [Bacteroidales bacterium]